MRAGKATDVRGLNVIRILLYRHGLALVPPPCDRYLPRGIWNFSTIALCVQPTRNAPCFRDRICWQVRVPVDQSCVVPRARDRGYRGRPPSSGRKWWGQSPPGHHDFRSMRTARQPSGDDDKTPKRVMDEFDARLSVVTRLAGGARPVVPDSVGRVVAPVRPRPAQPALQGGGNASSSPRGFSRGKSPRTKRALRAA